ncbi:polysaccharide deacetylase family protein [Kitasatospora sp. NPDC057965]|uniref:polysaccharide deacetylase family protein n=1 Tax=Kitasatospora sp. NPDC057965 TaxID=3346291 RepID=UPI0036DE9B56
MGVTREGYRIAVPGAVEVFEHCGVERPVARLIELAARTPDGLTVVVDSANGIMDASLTAAGVRVLRADPPLLADGGATAEALAALGRSRAEDLAVLPAGAWTMSGREEEIAAADRAGAPVESELSSRGRLLTGREDTGPLVALTFDDGPHPEFTPRMLDVLHRHDAPAAFFCIGLNALAHPAVVRRIADAGQTLGNHTWSHAYLPDLGPIGLARQLGHTREVLAEACGDDRPVRWLRPPYGGRSPELLRAVDGLGLVTVLWDVDAKDWSRPGPEVIADRILSQVRPGSVILMHDGGEDRSQTVAALPAVITGLRARGYRLVTLDQLLAATRPVAA